MAASEIAGATTTLNAHMVGNLFVEQYYPILHQQPEEVHKFYMECSVLSRPDCNGVMQSVTSMQAIDEKVMSVDYKGYTVEIKTVDSQPSYKDGVIVLVTGLLTGKDGIVQKFSQSFFLAPMENSGYFVLNDVLRFVVEDPLEELESVVVNEPDASSCTPATSPDLTAAPALDTVNTKTGVTEDSSRDETHESSENGGTEARDIPMATSNTSQICVASELVMSSTHQPLEDTPKKSYASIVKVARAVAAAPAISSSNVKVQTTAANTETQSSKQSGAAVPLDARVHTVGVNVEVQTVKQLAAASIPHPVSSVPDKSTSEENGSPPEDVEGYSIYVRNLPLNATPSQVEGEFKKFGPIKSGGVQVRNHKQHGYCFGFVEFEDLSSMESAIEASVTIAGRHIVVEEKRTSTRVGPGGSIVSYAGGRGRFLMARGGYRNDGFRGYNMRNDNFRGDAMRNGGFRGDGMRNDGFRGDMRNDGFRGDGMRNDIFRGDSFRDRGGYGSGQGFGRNDFRIRGEFFPQGRGGNRAVEGYHRVGRPNINRTAIPAA